MRVLVIEKAAVKQNISGDEAPCRRGRHLRRAHRETPGAPASAELAQLLRDEGIGRFAVSEVEEAEALRKAGFVDEEILMLRSTTDREELERLVDLNVVCTISSVDTGMALNALAENRSTVAEAHIQVDTGHGLRRLSGGGAGEDPAGLPLPAQRGPVGHLHPAPRRPAQRPGGQAPAGAVPAGAGRHPRRRVRDRRGPRRRLLRPAPRDLRRSWTGCGPAPPCWAGAAAPGTTDCSTVGYGEAPLAEVRWLPKGHTLGADKPVILKKPTRVAVLPVGYQNGFGVKRPRETGLLAALAPVAAEQAAHRPRGGQRARVLGARGVPARPLRGRDRSEVLRGDVAILRHGPPVRPGLCLDCPVPRGAPIAARAISREKGSL